MSQVTQLPAVPEHVSHWVLQEIILADPTGILIISADYATGIGSTQTGAPTNGTVQIIQ